jgi:hypothetical protein
MKKLFILASAITVLFPAVANAQNIQHGFIRAADGTLLGTLNPNKYDGSSVCNQYGKYGNKYGESIFNVYGKHGGTHSEIGANNPRAKYPPLMFHPDGRFFMYVTKNPRFQPRVEPTHILSLCAQYQQ